MSMAGVARSGQSGYTGYDRDDTVTMANRLSAGGVCLMGNVALYGTILLFVSSCGTSVLTDPLTSDPVRLDLTQQLRDSCRDTQWATDGAIRGLLALEEGNRLNRFSFENGLASLLDQCNTDRCFDCRVAILEQVYGK